MTYNHLGEYDDYTLPEPLKKETPESKAKLEEIHKKIREMARIARERAKGTEE